MGADISRVRFDPLRDFAGVVLQQGRLLLDADFNELVALLDRRLRAETSDLTSFGPDPDHAGVAWVPRQTPDAFRVTLTGGALSIGRGRMYVDGLLAENHGAELDGFDPLLSEVTGTADTPYGEQPYWPTPDPLPTGGAAPRVPRRLAARGHPPRGSRTSSRSPSASTRPRAGRRPGRCGSCPCRPAPPARPTTRTSPTAGST